MKPILLILVLMPALTHAVDGSHDWKDDWTLVENFAIDIDTEGYRFPSAIAFVPEPGTGPKDPLYFVSEL
ncbi:MAG: glucose dehydrogenase, partial [Candidatus Dadabacteria bacterium]|nr:glucose dehydrogenase [Candidatus Dadabacteria bacterium]